MKKQRCPELPAGLTTLEIYRVGDYTANAVFIGKIMPFSQLPDHIKEWFSVDMLRDKKALKHVRQMLPLHASPDHVLEAFVACRYGNYDKMPDLDEMNKLHPDAPCCGREQICSGFGKVCLVPGRVNVSPCEYVVIRYIANGLTDEEIASEMSVSIHSIRSYMVRIREKLELSNRVQIALWAHNHNIQ